MKIAPVAHVKTHLSAYLRECAKGPVIVTKNGRPAAVLVAVANEAELERLVLAHTPRFARLLDTAERRIRKGRGIAHGAFWKALGPETRRPRRTKP